MPSLRSLTPTFIYLLLTATLGPLLFGFHLAELNAPSEVITCARKSLDPTITSKSLTLPQCIPQTPSQFGLITSFFTLGGLLGALSAGPLTARSGRLRTMLIASFFALLGPVFEALAPSIPVLALGRFLSGIGAGAATVVVPIYISELSPVDQRGFWGAFTQITTNLGILLTQLLGLFLSHGQMWRVILGVGGAIAGITMVGLGIGGLESPKWLVEHGRGAEGRRVLKKIRGAGVDITEEIESWNAEEEEEEETLLSHPNNGPNSRKDHQTLGPLAVLRDPETRTAVFAVCMIMLAQQLTGINSIVMYGVSLLSSLLAANSALLNVLVALVNVIITTSCAPLSDKLGRKTCLLASISGMGTSSLLLAIGIMHSIPILSAIAVVLFVASFGFGLGPIPFILASELVNGDAVGATQSWALAVNWIATFLVAQFFPLINEKMGKGEVYFLFAGFAAAFAAFVAWYVPETRGCKDADEAWGRKKSAELED